MAPSRSWTKTAMECSGRTLGALVGLCSLQAREITPSTEGNLILQNMDLQQQPLCGQGRSPSATVGTAEGEEAGLLQGTDHL